MTRKLAEVMTDLISANNHPTFRTLIPRYCIVP